jgi:hypothetical protein
VGIKVCHPLIFLIFAARDHACHVSRHGNRCRQASCRPWMVASIYRGVFALSLCFGFIRHVVISVRSAEKGIQAVEEIKGESFVLLSCVGAQVLPSELLNAQLQHPLLSRQMFLSV